MAVTLMSMIPLSSIQSELQHLVDAAEHRLEHCLKQLSDEQIRERLCPEMNSIANQILHVCGNLKQWAVDGILRHPSDRDRAAEFAANHSATRGELLQELKLTLANVRTVVSTADADNLLERRQIQGFEVTGIGALMHTIPHLVGHTHQVVQLTRWILGDRYQFDWDPDGDRSSVPL